ncbi:hypothetical protein Tco_1420801 [Tanacetum coccineum]
MIRSLEDSYTQVHSRQTQWQADMEIHPEWTYTSPDVKVFPDTSSTYSIRQALQRRFGIMWRCLCKDQIANKSLSGFQKQFPPTTNQLRTSLQPRTQLKRLHDGHIVTSTNSEEAQELSREQAYWLPANERASQTSNQTSPVTPFVHKCRPPSQVLASLRNVNAAFPQFEVKTKQQLSREKMTLSRNLDAQINIMKVMNEVPLRTKPATESRKPMPKSHTRNHRILPSKSVNARRAADHNRRLNVVDHNQFVIRSLKSVNTKTPQAKHSVNHTKHVWKATRKHNVNTTKTAWRPKKVVGSVKPQWRPTGRHFGLFDTCPLTRIVEPIVEPLELTPSVSSSSKVTMISRFTDCKLSDRKAGSKGISVILECKEKHCIRGTSLSRAGKPVKKVLLMNLSDHRDPTVQLVRLLGQAKWAGEAKGGYW